MTLEVEHLRSPAFQELLAPIWSYLAMNEAAVAVDAIFVFGGMDLHVPQHAANLYLDGHAPHVLVTGAAGRYTAEMFSRPEAEVFSYYMHRLGVPSHAILIEDEAKNTGDNVHLGMIRLLDSGCKPTRLLLVAKPFLMRRCVATFKRLYPEVQVFPSLPPGPMMLFVDRPRQEFAIRLLGELQRLREYPALGFIVAQDIPALVLSLERTLRSGLSADPTS